MAEANPRRLPIQRLGCSALSQRRCMETVQPVRPRRSPSSSARIGPGSQLGPTEGPRNVAPEGHGSLIRIDGCLKRGSKTQSTTGTPYEIDSMTHHAFCDLRGNVLRSLETSSNDVSFHFVVSSATVRVDVTTADFQPRFSVPGSKPVACTGSFLGFLVAWRDSAKSGLRPTSGFRDHTTSFGRRFSYVYIRVTAAGGSRVDGTGPQSQRNHRTERSLLHP